MKRRGFFRCALALVGLKALGMDKKLLPKPGRVDAQPGPPRQALVTTDYPPKFVCDGCQEEGNAMWIGSPGSSNLCPKCMEVLMSHWPSNRQFLFELDQQRKGSHLHVS